MSTDVYSGFAPELKQGAIDPPSREFRASAAFDVGAVNGAPRIGERKDQLEGPANDRLALLQVLGPLQLNRLSTAQGLVDLPEPRVEHRARLD
jgi:hypothetical protein